MHSTRRNLTFSLTLTVLLAGCQQFMPAQAVNTSLTPNQAGTAAAPNTSAEGQTGIGIVPHVVIPNDLGAPGAVTAGLTAGTTGAAAGAPTSQVAVDASVLPASAALSTLNVDPRAVNVRTAFMALRGAALAKAAATSLQAASGGILKSADGQLTATVPSGALTQDASIKIVPLDPTMLKSSGVYNPGVLFAADLGGATLAPGQAITVDMRVAADFVAKTQAMDPTFTPDGYNLRKDADGQWVMSMRIEGPTLGAGAAAPTTTNPNLFEFGSLPGAPLPAPAAQRRTLAVAEAEIGADNAALLADQTTEPGTDCSIPLWMVVHNESIGVWGCGSVDHHKICWDLTAPPAQGLKVAALWTSDDPAFSGKVIPGLPVHVAYNFETWWAMNVTQGAANLVTDTKGLASTFAARGSSVTLTATHQQLGLTKSVMGRADGALSVTFDLPHNKPVITLHVGNCQGSGIPSTLVVKYNFNGVAQPELKVSTGAAAGKATGDVAFTVPVPGEAYYPVTLTDVHSINNDFVKPVTQANQTISVQTNGKGAFKTDLYFVTAK